MAQHREELDTVRAREGEPTPLDEVGSRLRAGVTWRQHHRAAQRGQQGLAVRHRLVGLANHDDAFLEQRPKLSAHAAEGVIREQHVVLRIVVVLRSEPLHHGLWGFPLGVGQCGGEQRRLADPGYAGRREDAELQQATPDGHEQMRHQHLIAGLVRHTVNDGQSIVLANPDAIDTHHRCPIRILCAQRREPAARVREPVRVGLEESARMALDVAHEQLLMLEAQIEVVGVPAQVPANRLPDIVQPGELRALVVDGKPCWDLESHAAAPVFQIGQQAHRLAKLAVIGAPRRLGCGFRAHLGTDSDGNWAVLAGALGQPRRQTRRGPVLRGSGRSRDIGWS